MYSLCSALIVCFSFTFFLPAGVNAQSSPQLSQWELHHLHGLFGSPSATATFPATSATGRRVGSYEVEASCDNDFVTINATMSASPGLEIIRIPKNLAAQVDYRSAVTVNLNGEAPIPTTSILEKQNAVSVIFITPDFNKSSAGSLAVLAWTINGVRPIGPDEALYGATSVKIEAVAKRSTAPSFPELIHFTFQPQEPGFQAFATECRHQLLGHEEDPNAVLSDVTDRAVKMLPPDEATQLHSIAEKFGNGLKTNDELALNDARTMLTRLKDHGPRARCSNKNKQDCEVMQALSDVDVAMIAVRQKHDAKVAAEYQATNLLAPARTRLQLVFSDKIGSDQITNGAILTAKLAAPLTNGGKVSVEAGTVVHLRSIIVGASTGFKVTDIVVNGKTLPLSTSQCQVSITPDAGNSGYHRPSLQPGQKPFHQIPQQSNGTRSIQAGSSCSVSLAKSLSKR